MYLKKSIEIGGRTLSIETGKMAKQADGSTIVQYGDTVILATAVASKEEGEDRGFFPLSVEYKEKTYAAGKIPGGFFKREGRPQEKEILSARMIDRPIRPLFPDNFNCEVQIMVTVLSSDAENDADVLGTIGTSAALCFSDIPFEGPIASLRVGRINGKFIVNPTFSQLDESDMDITLAATDDAIAMVEGEASEISEDDMLQALDFGHEEIKKIIALQKEMMAVVGKEKRQVKPKETNDELDAKVRETAGDRLATGLVVKEKMKRQAALRKVRNDIHEELAEEFPDDSRAISNVIHDIEKEFVRNMILDDKKRIDGRSLDDVRNITCETGILPRTHGSALFTRGETQSLSVATLGTKMDEQKIEGLDGQSWKSYMLHYNFPPFCVGEVKRHFGPSRREIGHGNLAERSLKPVIPADEMFPYTMRLVSEILESNGSSSMATVCGGSLALMDAGVPIKAPVAGVAMGMIKEGEKVAILTDILGDEDHLGDMDFKVAGTKEGITAVQMDIKISGISRDLMEVALQKAHNARMHILGIMNEAMPKANENLSPYAPRITAIKIDVNDIGMVIGPGGKMIREIIEKSGAEVNIDDDGTVQISSADEEACLIATEMVQTLVQKPDVGKTYMGKVKKITNFGAFVEILPGKEGLLHISEIAKERVSKVEDHLKVGQEIEVKLLKVTPEGKLDLSHKALL